MERINPENAPVGARLLIERADVYGKPLSEVTILEWSPSGQAVHLKYRESNPSRWVTEMPVLVEVLPPAPVVTINRLDYIDPMTWTQYSKELTVGDGPLCMSIDANVISAEMESYGGTN